MKRKLSKEKYISIITVVVIFILWFASTSYGWVNDTLIPSPQEVWTAFISVCEDYKGYSLLEHLGVSMQRLFIAFALAVVRQSPWDFSADSAKRYGRHSSR